MAKPELLAPAKNLERLKVVVTYGADAVYVGGERYGLRARADNFTLADLAQGVAFAHRHGAKVYVALNAFLHDTDLTGLGDYCQELEALGIDAVIVSDLGVIREIQKATSLAIHLSTQASCLNSGAAQLWQRAGVRRFIVGRELSIAEAGAIQQKTGLEVEMFTHGAMCMAYSGHCTISNFTAGRDSNRGGCIQSCRLPYFVSENTTPAPIPFMSSRDLWGIDQIEAFVQHGICSLKIEGRMKSSFYGAIASRVYRRLIDAHAAGTLNDTLLNWAAAELRSVPHRDYFTGSLATPAGPDSVFTQAAGINVGTHQYIGMVMETTPDAIVVHLVEPLSLGDDIEVVPPTGAPLRWRVSQMQSVIGEPQTHARQESIVRFPKNEIPNYGDAIAPFQVIRQATPTEVRQEVAIAIV